MADIQKKRGLTLHMTGARWMMVGLGVLGLLGTVIYVVVSGSEATQDEGANVSVHAPGQINNTPGKSTATYAKEVDGYNKRNAQVAEKQGKSFVGIPVTSIVNSNLQTNLQQQKNKNTQIQEKIKQEKANIKQENAPVAHPVNENMQPKNTGNSLYSEIAMISNAFKSAASAPQIVPVTEYTENNNYGSLNFSSDNGKITSQKKASGKSYMMPVTGDIVYAVMDNEAKSSIPGSPVMGTLLQAPFLKEKVIGTFAKPSGANYLIIRFTTLVLPNGQTVSINAIAVDPHTTLPALATNVDRHFFARAGAFLGEAFLAGAEGYGQAIAQQGSTVSQGLTGTTSTYPTLTPAQTLDVAIGQAAQGLQPLSSALNDVITEPNTVSVKADEPFDLFVVKGGKS